MNPAIISRHAEERMRQRGLRRHDIELIIGCGSEIGEDVFFLSRKDADQAIRQRKKEIQAIERLRDKKVVLADDTVVTCYHSRASDQKRILRKGRECR